MHIPFCYEGLLDEGFEPSCISAGVFEAPVSTISPAQYVVRIKGVEPLLRLRNCILSAAPIPVRLYAHSVHGGIRTHIRLSPPCILSAVPFPSLTTRT